MSTLRLSFLGPANFHRDEQPVELTIVKVHALLAYLALTQSPQNREHLLDLLWSESAPDAARKNLRNTLWRLRQTLGNDALVAKDDTLMLAGSVWTDVAAFATQLPALLASEGTKTEQLAAVLALWRGPLLQDTKLTAAADFELWLAAERARLGQLYVDGLHRLMVAKHAAQEWDEVIETARAVLKQDDTHEDAHAALMEGYAQLGQRSAALRQYATLRTTLAQELQQAPSPKTQTLHAQIIAGTLTPASGLPASRPDSLSLDQPRPRSVRAPGQPFVGRERERRALDEALQGATANAMQIVLLTGELGIGKSTLLQQWTSTVSDEPTILAARCLESTRGLPFAPLTGLFAARDYLEHVAARQSTVSPVWLTELTRLIPQIRDMRPELPGALPLPPEEEQRRLFEAFVQSLRSITTPIILLIDDLHWADQASLDWLTYLADRMHDAPLLLVAAYRANEADPALHARLAGWQREHAVRHIALSPFTIAEAQELIAALDGNVEMVDYLHAQSSGNPYYLTELSRIHPDGTPAALAQLLSARLRSLPQGAQRLLQVAAILEPAIHYDVLERICQQDEEETLDALDTLLELDMLKETRDRYEFAHPLLARIVRDELSHARRTRLHRRAAEELAATYADRTEAVAGQLMRHYLEADERLVAAHYAEVAAAQAVEMGAMLEAVNFYRQAQQLESTPDRQLALGYALMHIPGGLAEARQAMMNSLLEFEEEQNQAGIVQAGLRLAVSFLSTEEGERVLDWAERIQEAAPDDLENVELQATIQYLMAAGKFHTRGQMAAANAHYATATRLATEYNLVSDIAIQSWFGWGNLSVQSGDYDEAQAKFAHTLEIARRAGNIYFEALCYNNLSYAALLAKDIAAARNVIETGLAFIETNVLLRPGQYLYSTRGEIALAAGELADAERWFERALAEAQSYDNRTHAINIQAQLGRVAQAQGDSNRAETLLKEARDAIPPDRALFLRHQIDLWMAELYLGRDDRLAAQRVLDKARRELAGTERKGLQRTIEQLSQQLDAQ